MHPRSSIPPTLFGQSVELDHVFDSKWVLSDLDQLQLSMSCSEVARFKHSVLVNEESKKFLKEVAMGTFSLCSTENVDHNLY